MSCRCFCWLGLRATQSHHIGHADGQRVGLGHPVVRFIGSAHGPAPYSKSDAQVSEPMQVSQVRYVNWCAHLDKQLPCSTWLGLQASPSHQTKHADGQRIGLGPPLLRFIGSARGPAPYSNERRQGESRRCLFHRILSWTSAPFK